MDQDTDRGVEYPLIKGGADYYSVHAVQPLEYIERNHLSYHQGNVVKYVTRYHAKGGIEDLEKAIFYLRRMIQLEASGWRS
jgi:hypothetical protein